MHKKNILKCRRIGVRRRRIECAIVIAAAGWVLALSPPVHGAPLLEESFNYNTGTSLGADSPWAGSASGSLGVVAGSLTVSNLQSVAPGGNQLRVNGGTTTANAYRSFSSAPVTSGAVYCSFLINCTAPPTNSQFTLALLRDGATSANPPDDPLDLYVRPLSGGFGFTIRSGGSDPASASRMLATNSTHLVVVKYEFGSTGQGSVYVDPIPGAMEPLNADASTSSDDDNTGASSLRVILFRASSSGGSSSWNFDTVRVGTNWADVTPLVAPLLLSGPDDQAVCLGNSATFSLTASGTAPYFYSWRTNGVSIPGATNSTYQVSAPGMLDASNSYDVVVRDGFGTVTSRVARLTLSSIPASIVTQPADRIVTPSSTSAVFSVAGSGDAPLTFQWRTNGVTVAGATNSNFTITNPASADPSILYDVVVANPCGAVTSSPPARLLFPNVFYEAFDAGPGFFSGENLLLTNRGGLTLQTWSSDSLAKPVTQWGLEGPMQEQPLNDGTGKSFYSINVTPATSPVYYIFGSGLTPPYLAPIPILTVTTDASGFYILADSSMAISANGTLVSLGSQILIAPHAGGGLELSGVGAPGSNYLLQVCTDLKPPAQWLTVQTNIADANGLIWFLETNTSTPTRFYRISGQ